MTQFWVGVIIGVSFYGAILGVVSIAEDESEEAKVTARRLPAFWRRRVAEIQLLLK